MSAYISDARSRNHPALFALFASSFLLLALLVAGCGGDSGAKSSSTNALGMLDSQRPEEGKPAPNFALVDARDPNHVVKLSDFRGKVVVVNWYATWCGPCKAEIPDFQRVAQAFPNDVVILGVNLKESSADAVGMLESLGATYPAVLDSDGSVASHFRFIGMPATLLVDRDGTLKKSGSGSVSEETLRRELAKLGVQ